MRLILLALVAYHSATVGKKQEQEEFSRLLRDVVARGRAAGVIVIAATQRPSVDIIPTSLRDLFGYRLAFRCMTEISSDIILGHGWAKAGYDASKIAPEDLGVGWLRAEGGVPAAVPGLLRPRRPGHVERARLRAVAPDHDRDQPTAL